MRDDPVGPTFAKETRKQTNEILRHAVRADITGAFALGQAEAYVKSRTAPVSDTRPTLRQQLKEMRFGKEPQPPVPTESPVAAVRRELTEQVLAINAELTQQPRRRAELEHERDQLAAQLEALRGAT